MYCLLSNASLLSNSISKTIDDDVLDIKLRALFSIEDKFKSAGPNLENLDVDPYKLIQSLVGWLHRKPVNHEDRVLQLIIAILNVG